jgi:transcription termination factor Rho
MAVLERAELQASSLADLHAIADQLGLDGFRRLRKAELIDAILGEGAPREDHAGEDHAGEAGDGREPAGESATEPATEAAPERGGRSAGRSLIGRGRRRVGRSATARSRGSAATAEAAPDAAAAETAPDATANEEDRADVAEGVVEARDAVVDAAGVAPEASGAFAEGVVELLGNGSAFLRVAPPEASSQDVYISAAQVRRCELISGDRVTGPVRPARRSERYPSLVRIDTINGASADSASGGVRYDDLPVAYPTDRFAFDSQDPTLEAIEWLTPLGRGSRAVIVGAARAGKTEILRRMLLAVSSRDDLDITLALVGARPEEIAEWQDGAVAPVAALSFAASADLQGQAVERAIDAARRVAARGGDALVLIDTLDGLHPHAARKALGGARNLRDAGSVTVIATASRPFGGETTVIALDASLTATGRQPILDLVNSGTLKPELLVGEDGARAITQARALALEAGGLP